MGYVIKDKDSGKALVGNAELADSFWSRFLGLMGRQSLAPGQGLLLKKTGSVHTCFMRFPICVVYLDKEYQVIEKEILVPWRCGRIYRKAAHVLELGVSDGERIHIGMKLEVERWD
ncbi:MAG: DUF192 domain-containing protein [Clostridium sp.]|nr:DUF192 domain-containing protein [Clostridium sp.]